VQQHGGQEDHHPEYGCVSWTCQEEEGSLERVKGKKAQGGQGNHGKGVRLHLTWMTGVLRWVKGRKIKIKIAVVG